MDRERERTWRDDTEVARKHEQNSVLNSKETGVTEESRYTGNRRSGEIKHEASLLVILKTSSLNDVREPQ